MVCIYRVVVLWKELVLIIHVRIYVCCKLQILLFLWQCKVFPVWLCTARLFTGKTAHLSFQRVKLNNYGIILRVRKRTHDLEKERINELEKLVRTWRWWSIESEMRETSLSWSSNFARTTCGLSCSTTILLQTLLTIGRLTMKIFLTRFEVVI